jgi:cytochrome c5
MRTNRIAVAVVLACLLLAGCSSTTTGGSAASGAGSAPAQTGSTGASTTGAGQDAATVAVIESQCTKCHNIDRIKSASHDEAGWRKTIARMQGKGAQVTADQVTAIATLLANGGGSQL